MNENDNNCYWEQKRGHKVFRLSRWDREVL